MDLSKEYMKNIQSVTFVTDGQYVDIYSKIEENKFSKNVYMQYDDGTYLCINCEHTITLSEEKDKDAVWVFIKGEDGKVSYFETFANEEEMFQNDEIANSNPIRLTNSTEEELKEAKKIILESEDSVFYMPVLFNGLCPECSLGLNDPGFFDSDYMCDILNEFSEDPGTKSILTLTDGTYYVLELQNETDVVLTHYVKKN